MAEAAAPEQNGEQTDTDEGTIECGPDKVAEEFASLIAEQEEQLEEHPTVPEGAAAFVAEAREEKTRRKRPGRSLRVLASACSISSTC